MQRPGTSGVRPGTSSGARGSVPGKVEGFIVRIRTAQATVRCVMPNGPAQTQVRELREQIQEHCAIPVAHQALSRTRRPWFVDTTTSAQATQEDDFPDSAATLEQAGVKHGDMLFLESSLPVPAATPGLEGEDALIGSGGDGMQPPDLTRSDSTQLMWKGMDLTDENDSQQQQDAADGTSSSKHQQSALQILTAMRQEALTISFPSNPSTSNALTQEKFDELQRLIQHLSHPLLDWARASAVEQAALANAPAAASASSLSHNDPPTDRSTAAQSDQVESLQRGDEDLDHSSRTSSSRGGSMGGESLSGRRPQSGRLSSAGTDRAQNQDASIAADPSASNSSSAAAEDALYWRGRYDRLRVKAEKMNSAGMSLKNRFDTAQMQHEKILGVLRGRVQRRDERIAQLERLVAAWSARDISQGGDGTIELPPMMEDRMRQQDQREEKANLTSLAAAPTIRRPTPPSTSVGYGLDETPAPSPSHAPSPPASASRRVRPESAGRYRSRVVDSVPSASTGASVNAADPSLLQARPSSSAGRSRAPPSSSSHPSSADDAHDSLSSLSSTASILPPDPEREARLFRQAQADALVASSRVAMRQAVDSAGKNRSHMSSVSRNGAVVAQARPIRP